MIIEGLQLKIPTTVNSNRQNFSLKRMLVSLNRDLELVIFRIDDKIFDHFHFNHSHSIQLDQLSNLQLAVLFLEDRRFFAHRGVELRAPARAVKRVCLGKRMGAVSTIDQQVVRICTGRYERTLRRKVRESVLAFFFEFSQKQSSNFLHVPAR